ncbi:MAG: glycosyltransferase [Anaerolineae bacterium]|nr:glycosyltransferase [Anaerolineae bacterium]
MTSSHCILFITANLGGGGAERALVNVINHLDRARFRPHLALFQREGVFLGELAPDVPVYELQPTDHGPLHRNWVRMRAIRRLCDRLRPALVMSVKWQVNFSAALTDSILGLGCPLITNEQVALGQLLQSAWQRYVFWPTARHLYRRVARIVAISQGIAVEMARRLALPLDKFRVIHNPIAVTEVRRQAAQPVDISPMACPLLVAVGRLDPQKNLPLLFRAVARVMQEQPVMLYVLGEGRERPRLEALIQSLGLQSHIHLLGFQRNPYAYVKRADLFVLSSDYEGFANVLVEALAVGTPVVATDCPYGPREILADGQYGRLVPPGDESALAQAILAALQERANCDRAALQRRADEFAVERIVPQYEQLLTEVLQSSRRDDSQQVYT